ncbi:MAG: hypothetical protein ACYC7D_01190 [Nitrososphaerales archaeon]
MNATRILIVTLLLVMILEAGIIGYLLFRPGLTTSDVTMTFGSSEHFAASYSQFNAVIANDTEVNFTQSYRGSWILSVNDNMQFSTINESDTEAQVAIAPIGSTEALSIPTLIIQERADGLLRIEYYAQNWPNTYGLVLYNATRSDLFGPSSNISLEFVSNGPPSQVNPGIAPRSNGNLTVLSGSTVLVSNYPVAWASLDSAYFYGLHDSSFTSGELTLTIRSIQPQG